jgi:hypothetical protein
MNSTLSHRRFDVSTWGTEPSVEETSRRADMKNDQFPSKRESLGKRFSRALVRFVITFCIGVAATLAWLSYGDAAREMIASSSPQLGWLAPQPAASRLTVPEQAAPAAPSPDQQQLNAISLSLADLRQTVDQLARQLTAGQEQITQEITLLRAVEQEIVTRISVPPTAAAVSTQKPMPQPAAERPRPAPARDLVPRRQ